MRAWCVLCGWKVVEYRVESKVVATTEGRPAGGFDNRRMRTSSDMRWTRAKNNYESLLARPCRNHGDRPANHTVRQCNLSRPWPPPDERRNPAPNEAGRDDRRRDNRQREDRNRDDRQREEPRRERLPSLPPRGPDGYRNPDAAYIVFVSERDDKRSRRERFKEVNAVVPPVPQYLNWSEGAIT